MRGMLQALSARLPVVGDYRHTVPHGSLSGYPTVQGAPMSEALVKLADAITGLKKDLDDLDVALLRAEKVTGVKNDFESYQKKLVATTK